MDAHSSALPKLIKFALFASTILMVNGLFAAGAISAESDDSVEGDAEQRQPRVTRRSFSSQPGVLSAMLGDVPDDRSRRKTAKSTPSTSEKRQAAIERAKGFVPQFMTMFSRNVPLPKQAAKEIPPHAATWKRPTPNGQPPQPATRQASIQQATNHQQAAHRQPTKTAQRPRTAPNQAAYQSAASAERHAFHGAGAKSPAGSHSRRQPSQPIAKQSRQQPTAKPVKRTVETPPLSGPARRLVDAYRAADSAQGEADFSHVFLTCRDVATGGATDEEAIFAKQLGAWALNRRGQLKAADGRISEAVVDFNAAVRLDAKQWRAIHNRGVLSAQTGRFEEAFDDFQLTTQLNPDFAKAYSNRAALNTLAGEFDASLADYQRAVELEPTLAIAQRGLGRVYHMVGNLDEALEHLSTALELTPNDAAALASRGDLLTDMGRYAEADSDYEQALRLKPNSVDACRGSAWLLATCPDESIRDADLAVERARLVIERERKASAESYNVLAAAYAGAGNFQQAVQAIDQAIELAHDSERTAYEDLLMMYQESTPLRIEPQRAVQQASFEQSAPRSDMQPDWEAR